MVIRPILLHAWLVGSLAVPILAGCSYRLQIALFNNTSEPISVQLESNRLVAESGQFVLFDYPGDTQAWAIRLSVADCVYTYQAPKSLEHYPWSRPNHEMPLKVQLDKDLGLYPLPPSAAGVQPISDLGALLQDGFSLHPISKSCR